VVIGGHEEKLHKSFSSRYEKLSSPASDVITVAVKIIDMLGEEVLVVENV
jgi:hypothetical protein